MYIKVGVHLPEKVPLIIISIQPYTQYLSLRSMETYASSSTAYLFSDNYIVKKIEESGMKGELHTIHILKIPMYDSSWPYTKCH